MQPSTTSKSTASRRFGRRAASLLVVLAVALAVRSAVRRGAGPRPYHSPPLLAVVWYRLKYLVSREPDTEPEPEPDDEPDGCGCPPEEQTALCRAGRHTPGPAPTRIDRPSLARGRRPLTLVPPAESEDEPELDPLGQWVAESLRQGARTRDIIAEGERTWRASRATINRRIRDARQLYPELRTR